MVEIGGGVVCGLFRDHVHGCLGTIEGQGGQAYLLDLIHGCGNGWLKSSVVGRGVTSIGMEFGPRKVFGSVGG